MVQTTVDLTRSAQSRSPIEGDIAQRIEQQAARVPTISYVGLALASMVTSAVLAVYTERRLLANIVGMWAPSFLLMGIYNKLVRLESEETGVRRVA